MTDLIWEGNTKTPAGGGAGDKQFGRAICEGGAGQACMSEWISFIFP